MGSQYCFVADVQAQINPIALTNITTTQITAACQEASEEADSYLRGRYALPLLAWGSDITSHVARIAVYILLTARGYNPAAGADDLIRIRYEHALEWFRGIQRQSVHPDVTPSVAQPGDTTHDLPQVRTSPQRGWQNFNGSGSPAV